MEKIREENYYFLTENFFHTENFVVSVHAKGQNAILHSFCPFVEQNSFFCFKGFLQLIPCVVSQKWANYEFNFPGKL
jgi:hypothetical protein